MPWLLLLFACQQDATPLGMILELAGVTYAGSAVIDITPVITDLFEDVDGDHLFSGCMDDPDAETCAEGFEDVDIVIFCPGAFQVTNGRDIRFEFVMFNSFINVCFSTFINVCLKTFINVRLKTFINV